MQQLQIVAIIAVSGSLGALARYAVVIAAHNVFGGRFPWGTLLVNVIGCFVMGIAAAALPAEKHSLPLLRYGVMVGFLGAFTTFSAFSLETIRHLESGQGLIAMLNVVGNVALCLLMVWLGQRAGQFLI